MSARDEFIEQAYLKWRLPLLRFLQRKLGNAAEAEDMAQESFLRWFASRADSLPDNPKAYVTRIALNATRESAHKRGTECGSMAPLEEDDTDQYGAAPAELTCPQRHAENRQMLDRIEQALRELPERQREAFILHRFDGLVYEEIAAEMRISRAMVSKHISQAMAYCRLRVNYPTLQAMKIAVFSKEDADNEA